MRNIPSSGFFFVKRFPQLVSFLHPCVCFSFVVSLIYYVNHAEEIYLCENVCLFASVCLPTHSLVSALFGFTPGFFPTQMSYLCWEHVSLLPPLTPSSSHTGCLMAPSTMCSMKALVSIFIVTRFHVYNHSPLVCVLFSCS